MDMRIDSAGGNKSPLGLQFCGTATDWEVGANCHDGAILDSSQEPVLLGAPGNTYLDTNITIGPYVGRSHHCTIADDQVKIHLQKIPRQPTWSNL